MIDAHNHLQFFEKAEFDRAVVAVRHVGIVGALASDYDAVHRARLIEIGAQDHFWITLGLHPWSVAESNDPDGDFEILFESVQKHRDLIVGLGELGLDYLQPDRDEQLDLFRRQLSLARDLELPVVIHAVKAHHDVIATLKKDGLPRVGGMVHGFAGSRDLAETYAELNVDISIGGAIRRTHNAKIVEAIRAVGVERLMVESDAPCHPLKKDDQREPSDLIYVIDAVAKALEISPEEVAEKTAERVRKRFNLTEVK